MVERHPARRFVRGVMGLGLGVVLCGVGFELAARIAGHRPWRPIVRSVDLEPPGAFFRSHDKLGYAGRPGAFHVTLNPTTSSSVSYRVTHDADGYRISEPPRAGPEDRPEVWLFGGSFTHGYGVDDDETYAWRLQQRFSGHRFRNYGMDAYGTYHSFLQFEDLLARGKRAAFVILAYASFHDARNVRSRYWTKTLAPQPITKGITYPYVRLGEDGNLTPHGGPIDYFEWPGMRTLAAVHLAESSYNRLEDRRLRSFEVTAMLIEKMIERARERRMSFVLGGVYPDDGTKAMVYSMGRSVPILDLSLPFDDPTLRIRPHDSHPSPKGHRVIADRLGALLEPYLVVAETQEGAPHE